jgi:CDGSH-type Zn-finger protein
MDTNQKNEAGNDKQIIVKPDGPYVVKGNIPLVHKTQVVSEFGEPLTWQKDETLVTSETYSLCRCGYTHKKPFCDGAHRKENFEGTETADVQPTASRQSSMPGGTHIHVKVDSTLCMESGFCGNRKANLQQLVNDTEDTGVRGQVMAMIERCPSGSLTYSIEDGGADIEPDFPKQVAVTTEITSHGPIDGPLWVTGSIPIQRADGQSFESRNRVTLCNCGLSKNKPLCDGTHRPKDTNPSYGLREK